MPNYVVKNKIPVKILNKCKNSYSECLFIQLFSK